MNLGPVLVLLSGGRDSTCLLDMAVSGGGGPVWALHVNYGLRGEESDTDEAFCRALCARLGVELFVLRAGAPSGNVQAWAREVRYAEAERLAAPRDAVIATGHTATDQVETVLYRLAASPGRRALLGMPSRSGRLVRPLLGMTREDTAAYCVERGLTWREDTSNATSARGLIRATILPALRELHPAAEQNILATLAALRDEASVLDAAVDAALGERRVSRVELEKADARGSGAGTRGAGGAGGAAGSAGALVAGGTAGQRGAAGSTGSAGESCATGVPLAALPPALARLVLQRLADDAVAPSHAADAGDPWRRAAAPSLAAHADAVIALAAHSGTVELDLPGGLRAISEYGRVRIERRGAAGSPISVELPVPGRVAFGAGELICERGDFPIADGTLAAGPLAATLEVRAWRAGDRMRPLGLGGSKSLQDLFTDRKVPRERRHQLPVVVSDGEIAWVPGVATGERFRVEPETRDRVRLVWRLDCAAP